MTSTPEIRAPIVTGLMRWCGALAVLAVLTPDLLRAEGLNEHQKEMVKQGTEHLKSFLSHSQAEALRNLLGAVRGVPFVPSNQKGGFLVGYERSNGMLFARHGDQWRARRAFMDRDNALQGVTLNARLDRKLAKPGSNAEARRQPLLRSCYPRRKRTWLA